MAIKGSEIRNPKTGHRIKFLQTASDTNGAFLEMISTYEAKSLEPPLHYHPFQEEYFEVISGEISVRINGEIEVLGPGHQLYIAKSTVHAMWNNSEKPSSIRWKMMPAMEMENFLETLMGLANEGKTKPNGAPGFLQWSFVVNRFHKVFRLARPPYFIQKILCLLLSPVAFFWGCKAEAKMPTAD
jgi:quercetin dioxygenase-like cupin family protein